jgi:hypothetical protein
MWKKRNVYRILVGMPEGKRPIGKPRCRWEDNSKWILEKYDLAVWTVFIWLRIGKSAGLL